VGGSDDSKIVVEGLRLLVGRFVDFISDPVAVDAVALVEVSRDDGSSSQSSVDISILVVLV
jgi:hypothetical protein